jgi:hypothetical protein
MLPIVSIFMTLIENVQINVFCFITAIITNKRFPTTRFGKAATFFTGHILSVFCKKFIILRHLYCKNKICATFFSKRPGGTALIKAKIDWGYKFLQSSSIRVPERARTTLAIRNRPPHGLQPEKASKENKAKEGQKQQV